MAEQPASDAELKSWLNRKGKEGVAELGAYLRGGLIDLQNAVTQAFPDSQQQASVLGMAGVPTPGEVDKAHGAAPQNDADIRKSVLGNLPKAPVPEQEHTRDTGRGGR